MIYFGFNITNPWSKRWKGVWTHTYDTPFKHKYLELEVFEDTTVLSFSFQLAIRQSHGGLTIGLGVLGYSFNFQFYDNRHWNYDEGRYFKYNEEEGMH